MAPLRIQPKAPAALASRPDAFAEESPTKVPAVRSLPFLPLQLKAPLLEASEAAEPVRTKWKPLSFVPSQPEEKAKKAAPKERPGPSEPPPPGTQSAG